MKQALEGDNLDEIKQAVEELNEVVQQLSTKLYEQAAQAQQAAQGEQSGQGEASSKQDDNVVDADYEVVDDKKS